MSQTDVCPTTKTPLRLALALLAGAVVIYPASDPISMMDAHEIWHNYLRYIGAGAVVFGGIVTLVRSLPVILESGMAVFGGAFGKQAGASDGAVASTERDLPGPVLIVGICVCALLMIFLPKTMAPGGFVPALLAIVFAFFFVAVSARIVGLIGSSSNPVSGMTIAALLATSLVFKFLGWTGEAGMATALAVGSIVCISAAIAGDTSQDLKTGYLVGATPWRQQAAEIVGVLSSAAVVGFVVLRLHQGYGIGSETLPAPQATLMSLVVKGVLSGDLPWNLIFIGVAAAAVIEIVGIPSLPFAVGLYLPLSLTTPILLGGVIRALVERKREGDKSVADDDDAESKEDVVTDRGVLFSSGLIAGSAFIGMALGLLSSFIQTHGLASCLNRGGGSIACAVKNPGDAILVSLDCINFGPAWAGRFQDLVAAGALLGMGVMLFWVARKGWAEPGSS